MNNTQDHFDHGTRHPLDAYPPKVRTGEDPHFIALNPRWLLGVCHNARYILFDYLPRSS